MAEESRHQQGEPPPTSVPGDLLRRRRAAHRRYQQAGCPFGDTPAGLRRWIREEELQERIQRPPAGLGQRPR